MTRHLPVIADPGSVELARELHAHRNTLRTGLRAFEGEGMYREDTQQHATSHEVPLRLDDPQWHEGDPPVLAPNNTSGRVINVMRDNQKNRSARARAFPPDPDAPRAPRVRSECLPRRVEALRYIGVSDDDIQAMYDARGSLPCPFASCRENLRVGEGRSDDSLTVPRADVASWLLLPATCALDEAERADADGTAPALDVIGAYMGLTRERVRQIEAKAVRKIARELHVPVGDVLRAIGKRDHYELPKKSRARKRRWRISEAWEKQRMKVESERAAARIRKSMGKGSRASA